MAFRDDTEAIDMKGLERANVVRMKQVQSIFFVHVHMYFLKVSCSESMLQAAG